MLLLNRKPFVPCKPHERRKRSSIPPQDPHQQVLFQLENSHPTHTRLRLSRRDQLGLVKAEILVVVKDLQGHFGLPSGPCDGDFVFRRREEVSLTPNKPS